MADEASASTEDAQITFNVKAASDKKIVVTVAANSTVADLKTKLSTPEYADIPADRQRLIYSGRVLKDHDTLSSAKIKDGHTVHLVKGAASNARQNPATQGAASSPSGTGSPAPQLPSMATGTGNNPLAGLTGARYAGFHGLPGADMFGPDGGMGPPPDSEQLLQMMDNPMFLSQMNEAMNNPAVIEMMTQNPMIRNNPMLADMIRNPDTRRMLFNPEMMRMQLQMQRQMGGGAGGQRFTAPGVTDNTAGAPATGGANATPNATQPQDPLAALLGGAGGAGAANPFGNIFGPGAANPFATPAQNATAPPTGDAAAPNAGATPNAQGTASPPPNPFANLFTPPTAGATGEQPADPMAEMTRNLMQNPEAMRAAMQMMNGMGGASGASPFGAPANPSGDAPAAANPFAGLFGPNGGGLGALGGMGSPPPPVDNRPPEELYESQLRQLNEMGFYEFDRNVQALRRSGGNVNGAIDWLLSNPN